MKSVIPSWIRILIIFFAIAFAAEYFIDSGDKPAFIEYPSLMVFLLVVLFILIAIEAITGALKNILYQTLDDAAKARFNAEAEKSSKTPQWIKNIYHKLIINKPSKEEHTLILDHNYDGILELDNDLPPWWRYGFYISILFGVIYLLKYDVFNGPSQTDELANEYAQAKLDIEAYKKTAKDLVDYNSVTILTDASDLNNGKILYDANCVACHKTDGGGSIGPNLTDEYWILGGGINNVFKTISEGGRDGKGMIAWSKNGLKPSQIAQVSSYVLSLQGTQPADAKAPEGEVWNPTN